MKETKDILLEARAALPALTGAREKKNEALARIGDFLEHHTDFHP
jgi:hypothetical protein